MPWYFIIFYFAAAIFALVGVVLIVHAITRMARLRRAPRAPKSLHRNSGVEAQSNRAHEARRRMAQLLDDNPETDAADGLPAERNRPLQVIHLKARGKTPRSDL